MVKGNPKSSATSATRKKHAKKHADSEDSEKIPKGQGGKGGKKNKEPRVKLYIPPAKPAPLQPDPLETTGLAHSLPADLLVILRNLSKKAQVTKIRALEDLQVMWVDRCLRDEDQFTVYTLVEMLPVWVSISCHTECGNCSSPHGSFIIFRHYSSILLDGSDWSLQLCNFLSYRFRKSRTSYYSSFEKLHLRPNWKTSWGLYFWLHRT